MCFSIQLGISVSVHTTFQYGGVPGKLGVNPNRISMCMD